MRILRDRHCDLNAITWSSESPLDLAIQWRSSFSVLDSMISFGMMGSSSQYFAGLPVDDACDVLEYLQKGSSPTPYSLETLQEGMRYVLENAISDCEINICKSLYALGCPLNRPLPTCKSCSPLVYALNRGSPTIVKWLLDQDRDKRTAIGCGPCEEETRKTLSQWL
jgi:hypothetical protein